MSMPNTALIDTSAIFALSNQNDPHHVHASDELKTWLSRRNTLILSDWMFAESMTLLKVRLGVSVALRVGRELRSNPVYRWVALSPNDEREVWTIFQKYTDKDWSYIDCGVWVMSQRLRVPQVFAFDGHFKQMPGVVCLPK